ncbi:transmembrane 6 superfamily member 1 [Xyrichtys novacula]|uniref:Transmembrane 6 superfamily member 1 n=1 Tax=Xyrichtys novacula TaxID=13765 RepID=A0AAV1EL42_XYRNO|nr:transmembrane 6 superfamily member 1 [Xyrichtys novacula]
MHDSLHPSHFCTFHSQEEGTCRSSFLCVCSARIPECGESYHWVGAGQHHRWICDLLPQRDPHINTAHGHMILYWDGCVHYLMYLLMIAAITWGDSYRAIGLYWVGSFLMRAIVYILGNAVGKYGTHVSPLFILHMLYISVSIWACFRIFSQPTTRDIQLTSTQEDERKSLLERPLDLFFIIYLIPAFAFCVFRGLIVLDCSSKWCQEYTQQYEPYLKDPSAYPKLQMLVSMLYSGPYYIITLYGLMVPGCEWMPDLTLVHSGALAQSAC